MLMAMELIPITKSLLLLRLRRLRKTRAGGALFIYANDVEYQITVQISFLYWRITQLNRFKLTNIFQFFDGLIFDQQWSSFNRMWRLVGKEEIPGRRKLKLGRQINRNRWKINPL